MSRHTPFWSTASYGEAADTSSAELSDLGDHLASCSQRNGRWAAVRTGALALHGFVTTRLVTTLALAVALIALALLLT
jgi:hypothetical protein